jgi:UDP-N-acetylmuramyl pentapeptide phosphotransferase/UDP-N-acetylglucosamine-1-phosphate transferase
MTTTTGGLSVAVIAFAACALVVALAKHLALRRGWLDVPNARSSHERPTPRLGGLGVLASLLAGGVAGAALIDAPRSSLVALLGLGAVVSIVSLVDDLRGLPAPARLLVHLAVSVAAVAALGPFSTAGLPSIVDTPLVAGAATVVWITAFLNFFNFMDGIDGIAGGQALAAGTGWAAAGWWTGEPILLVVGASVAAGAAAFLLYNWSPASIFMGDVGSALLGFVLATLPLAAAPPRPSAAVAVLAVWPFVFDAGFTIARRLRRGEPLMQAHRSHLYQRLSQAGWPHASVALLYLAAGAACAGLAASAVARGTVPLVAKAGLAFATAAVLWLTTSQAERRAARASVSEARNAT